MSASVILVSPLTINSWFLKSDLQTKVDKLTWYLPSFLGNVFKVSVQPGGKKILPGFVTTFDGNFQTKSNELFSFSSRINLAGFS